MRNIIDLDMDLLLGRKTFGDIRKIAETESVCSVPGVTFQSQLSDRDGNVLQIIPGQCHKYLEKPQYSVMTNFSPFKGDSEKHPWMGLDRYQKAVEMLESADKAFDTGACFDILKCTAQTACPTVVSMAFDAGDRTVYWCENREWSAIKEKHMTAG